jgi:hypothetical protein
VAKRKTSEADAKFDNRGKRIESDLDFGDNVIIVDQEAGELETPSSGKIQKTLL